MGPGITGMLCTHAVVSAVFSQLPKSILMHKFLAIAECALAVVHLYLYGTLLHVYGMYICVPYMMLLWWGKFPFTKQSDTYADQDRMGMLICWLLGVRMWRGLAVGYVEGVGLFQKFGMRQLLNVVRLKSEWSYSPHVVSLEWNSKQEENGQECRRILADQQVIILLETIELQLIFFGMLEMRGD